MSQYSLITAIGTPLTDDEDLHIEGLEAHIEDQWRNGINGILVGGTMGMMQLLSGHAYQQLVDHSIRFSKRRGEIMVGVGDTSYSRTLERIRLLNDRDVDAVVVLSPFLLKFTQSELGDYFMALADQSRHPLYLYDLPVLTGIKLSLETVSRVSEHPNIHGIKASCEFGWTRQLIDMKIPDFRVIVSQVTQIDVLMQVGVKAHLDGVFAMAPHWAREIAAAADRADWIAAGAAQRRLNALLKVLQDHGVMSTFTAIMNARGIAGRYAPKPMRLHDASIIQAIRDCPVVQELLTGQKVS